MNVPRLRFKDLDGREFPEWEKKTIEELVNSKIILKPLDGNHGELHPKSSDYVDIGIPFIMANDIRNNVVDIEGAKKISKTQADELQKGFSLEGDVLLTHKGSVGFVAIVPKLSSDYIMLTPQVTYYRVVNKEKLSNRFLVNYFISPGFQKEFLLLSGGGTRAYLGITEQRNLKVHIPCVSEQTKIANFLTAIDEKITQLTQKYDLLKQYKKGVMQQIFSQKLRFKDDDGREFPEWEELNFDDGFYLANNKKTQIKSSDYSETGHIPVVDQGQKRIVGYTNNKDVYDDVPVIIFGDHTRILKWIDFKFAPGADGTQVIKTTKKLNLKFGYYYLCNIELPNLGYSRHMKEMKEQYFFVPASIKEQTKIANFLTAIDDKITHTKTRLDAVKLYKKGLLQQMFV